MGTQRTWEKEISDVLSPFEGSEEDFLLVGETWAGRNPWDVDGSAETAREPTEQA